MSIQFCGAKIAVTAKMPPKLIWAAHRNSILHIEKAAGRSDGIKRSGTPDAAAGCHFTGPVALRHILSNALPKCIIFVSEYIKARTVLFVNKICGFFTFLSFRRSTLRQTIALAPPRQSPDRGFVRWDLILPAVPSPRALGQSRRPHTVAAPCPWPPRRWR